MHTLRPPMPGGSLILAIETSNPSSARAGPEGSVFGVALAESGDSGITPVGIESLNPGDRGTDPAALIARLLEKTGCCPSSIGRVVVSVGPGGYTGIRIAVVTAKLLAEAWEARCVAVPTADALLRRVDPGIRSEQAVHVALAWKRDDVWIATYPPGSDRAESTGLLALGAASEAISAGVTVADPPVRERLASGRDGAEFVLPRFDPLAVAETGALLPPVDPIELVPLYPRRPEAVAKWEQLRSPSGKA